MYRSLICAGLVALPLAACHDSGAGTSISITANDTDGNLAANANGATGEVSLNLPGFSGKMKLPKMHLDGEDFDMNGVHLYPGSKITALNIDAGDTDRGGDTDGVVHVAFDSPAAPDAVRTWFARKLGDAGFTLHQEGSALVGTTDDKNPFRLELAPAAGGHATGTITTSG